VNRRTSILLLTSVLIAANQTKAQEAPPAPFGLQWQKSAAEVQELGVKLTEVEMADFGTSYAATHLPKALSDLETVILSFGYNDSLFRIAAISREFSNDDFGTSVRSRYNELATSLAKSYSSGTVYERKATESYYSAPDKFSYAISERKAVWFRMFSSPDADIELGIGSSLSDPYWRLIYTHRDGEKEFQSAKGQREADAL